MMKLINKLLGKLHKLTGRLHASASQRAKQQGMRKETKLYNLRFERLLREFGINKDNCWKADYIYKNVSNRPKAEALSLATKMIGEQYGKTFGERLKAFTAAMSVQLPTLPERIEPLKKGTKNLWVGAKKIGSKVGSKGSTVIKWLIIVVVAILIVWGLSYLFSSKRTTNPGDNQSSDQTSAVCPAGSWQMQPMPADNTNLSWFDGGLDEIRNAKNPEDAKNAFNVWLGGKSVANSPQLYGVKNYHNLLMAAAQTFNIPTDDASISKDGECANDATIQLVYKIKLAQGQGTIEAGTAPLIGYNTGVEKGQVFGYATPGIQGDRRAIKITLKNGAVIWILGQCGNVFTSKEIFRHREEHRGCENNCGNEDHHPKPKCKGNECLKPKSSNPKDYKQPGDDNTRDSGHGTKPKATVTTPADSTPPKVKTSQTGGGGVTDSSTTKPGSESGMKAPGASNPPSTSTTKPNEGGSNNGVVTD